MAHTSDARIVGDRDAVAFRLVLHRAELADPERFAVFSNAPLHKEYRTFRVDFDEDGDD